MLVDFSELYIPPCVGNIFQCMMFTFLENALNLCNFTHAPVLYSKLHIDFFENLLLAVERKSSVRKNEDDFQN